VQVDAELAVLDAAFDGDGAALAVAQAAFFELGAIQLRDLQRIIQLEQAAHAGAVRDAALGAAADGAILRGVALCVACHPPCSRHHDVSACDSQPVIPGGQVGTIAPPTLEYSVALFEQLTVALQMRDVARFIDRQNDVEEATPLARPARHDGDVGRRKYHGTNTAERIAQPLRLRAVDGNTLLARAQLVARTDFQRPGVVRH